MKPRSWTDPPISVEKPKLQLRLLATSDLHMQLLDFDYVRDLPTRNGSLARLARLIEKARRDADVCLLVDNGDTFQGTPMAEYLSRSDASRLHPMVEAMNALSFDVVGLGNHDFDFGIAALSEILEGSAASVVCSNVTAPDLKPLLPYVVLTRAAKAGTGAEVPLKIGVVGAVPELTASWHRHHLTGKATVAPVVAALEGAASAARVDGADVVIALAHMGITLGDEGDIPQNQIIEVAKAAGIDAVVGGHTHLQFPGPDYEGTPGVDCTRGLVGDSPVVQPGYAGSALGVIDLALERHDDRWQVVGQNTALVKASDDLEEDQEITKIAARAHGQTRQYLSVEVAGISAPMNTFFALAKPSAVPALMGSAKSFAVQTELLEMDLEDLPLLAAASAPATGGFDGPDNFISLKAGMLQRRHIAGLNKYANQAWGVRLSGAQIIDWLERAALIYNTLQAGMPDQPLINPKVPGFRFDTIYGLSYVIDPTQAPAFDLAGRRTGASGRIRDVLWHGKPLPTDKLFLVATTDHRVGGGGAYASVEDADVAVRSALPLEDALLTYLERRGGDVGNNEAPWRFAPNLGVSAVLETAPAAADHLDEIASFNPEIIGENDNGFLEIRLTL